MSYRTKVFSGKEFNELYLNRKFLKVLRAQAHYRFNLVEGVNVDSIAFRPEEFKPGGLNFTDETNLFEHISVGEMISEVVVPDDAQVFVYNTGYKADKIILTKIMPIACLPNWSSKLFCDLMLDYNPYLIRFIPEPPAAMCARAVKKDGSLVRWINDPSHDICVLALTSSWCALEHIKNQTYEICKFAVDLNPKALQYVRDETIKRRLDAV